MRHPITKRACAPALVLCAGLSLSATARPDTPAPGHAAAAQALYDAANADMEAQSFAAARRKLEEVVRLLPDALGARLTLAECYQSLGLTASAWAEYTAAQAMATRQGQSERAAAAAEKVAALRPRLATLTLHVPPHMANLKGLVVTRDGAPIGDVQWGTPLPVDAGRHEIVVSAPGHARWTKTVEVASDGVQVDVTPPPLAPVLAAPEPAGVLAPDPPWPRSLGLGAIGAGGAGLFAGVAMLSLAGVRRDVSSGLCDARGTCDDAGAALRREARQLDEIAAGALIAGGLVAGVGVVVVLATLADGRPGHDRPRVRAAISPRGAALQWQF